MKKHTPLPWKINGVRLENGNLTISSRDKTRVVVCEMNNGTAYTGVKQEVNAAFIVKACNMHYMMLGALKTLLTAESMPLGNYMEPFISTAQILAYDKMFNHALGMARKAVEKAESYE